MSPSAAGAAGQILLFVLLAYSFVGLGMAIWAWVWRILRVRRMGGWDCDPALFALLTILLVWGWPVEVWLRWRSRRVTR